MEPNQRFSHTHLSRSSSTGPSWRSTSSFLPRNQNPLQGHRRRATIPDAPAVRGCAAVVHRAHLRRPGGLPAQSAPHPALRCRDGARPPTHARFSRRSPTSSRSPTWTTPTTTSILQPSPARSASRPPARARADPSRSTCRIPIAQSFNFVVRARANARDRRQLSLRHRSAAKQYPAFARAGRIVSWGQVFAEPDAPAVPRDQRRHDLPDQLHHRRRPTSPRAAGCTSISQPSSDYRAQLDADHTFIRRYAARIPRLVAGKPRHVFAAIQFPVLFKPAPGDADLLRQQLRRAVHRSSRLRRRVRQDRPRRQPVSQRPARGEERRHHPVKDVGISLGWDDEEITDRYIRQLATIRAGRQAHRRAARRVWVRDRRRETAEPAAVGVAEPRVRAVSAADGRQSGDGRCGASAHVDGELPYQVYPVQLDGDKNKNLTGCRCISPRGRASHGAARPGRRRHLSSTATAKAAARHQRAPARRREQAQHDLLAGARSPRRLALRHKIYEFRVPPGDLSGGGPELEPLAERRDRPPRRQVPLQALCRAGRARIDGLPANTDEILFNGHRARHCSGRCSGIRPSCSPANTPTRSSRLKTASDTELTQSLRARRASASPIPTSSSVEIIVELQTLKMDNLDSVSGRESYIHVLHDDARVPDGRRVFEDALDDRARSTGLQGAEVRRSRRIWAIWASRRRKSMRCRARAAAGSDHPPDHPGRLRTASPTTTGRRRPTRVFNTRYGRTDPVPAACRCARGRNWRCSTPRPKCAASTCNPIRHSCSMATGDSLLLGKEMEQTPDIVQRLAAAARRRESAARRSSARAGQRVQFGCSQRIRHTLAPDNSSITFASKGDLVQHWLCCIQMSLQRDWTWDGLEDRSFVLERTHALQGRRRRDRDGHARSRAISRSGRPRRSLR